MPTFRNDPDLLNLFFLAETLGKTVDELLLGRPTPISNIELAYWPAFWSLKNEIQEKANKGSSKPSKDAALNSKFKKTMGQ